MKDTRLEEIGTPTQFLSDQLARITRATTEFLEAGEAVPSQLTHVVTQSRYTLGIQDVLEASEDEKIWFAELGARCGTGLWRYHYLDGDSTIEFREHRLSLRERLRISEHIWFVAFLLAQISQSRRDLRVLRSRLSGSEPGDDTFMKHMREGLSAHLRGDGDTTAAHYLEALEAAHPERADYNMGHDEMFGIFVPALEIWDAIFRQDQDRVRAKLLAACEAHRQWYKDQGMLHDPESFVCWSAWAGRSWAQSLGMTFDDLADPHLPEVLPGG